MPQSRRLREPNADPRRASRSTELRPLGPQFLGDVWAKAVLPEPQEGLKRRRPPALPIAWHHLVRGAVDQVAWEDLHYQIVAHCSSRAVPPKIPEAQRFTSVTRLREIEPGMEAVLGEKVNLLRVGARTLESFDMRILTSGVYIHGLESWGRELPPTQLLVIRSEDMFADVRGTVLWIDSFLGLRPPANALAPDSAPKRARPDMSVL